MSFSAIEVSGRVLERTVGIAPNSNTLSPIIHSRILQGQDLSYKSEPIQSEIRLDRRTSFASRRCFFDRMDSLVFAKLADLAIMTSETR